jgi:small subunit ribosomal protein S17
MAVKERVGLVVSDKMEKTVVVAIENRAPHPKYGKIVVKTKRFKAHDEENKCKEGDRVRICETRHSVAPSAGLLPKFLVQIAGSHSQRSRAIS